MYAGKVGAANNGITIESNCANTFYLAQGRNDFRPVSGGKITQGTVHNNCSGQIIASNNRWKNTLVQPTQPNDYTLQKCNCIPNKGIGLLDANPQTQLTCPFQIVNPKNPNAAISTALDFCPNCPNINTASFSNVKLNIAVQQAIAQMEFQNPSGNDLTAIDMLYQILTYPLHQQHERFDWLNDFSYTQIKRALGNAFLTGRTTDISLSNVAVQKVLAIQDSIIAKAKASGDSFTQFYTSTDQAFVYHLIDQQQKTLELLDAISTCMPLDSMQNAFLTNARKIIFAEYLVASGEAKVEDFDLLLKRGYSFTSPSGISTVGDTGLAASTHCINETIQFRPSTFAKTYSWNFGNGQTSTLINPSTTYTVAGTYTVTLTTTTNCSSNNTFTTTVTINPLLTAKFGFDVCNTSVSFHDSTSNAVAFHWNFGDGNTSDIESPTHDYGSFGTYSVCLTATNPCGSNTICQYVAVLPQDQWTQKANFGGTPRFGVVSLTIGNKGYMGTGYDGNTLYQDFWEYDPLADSWTQKATFPGVARFVAVGFYFSVGTKGYIGTGWNGSGATDQSDFWEYDQSTNVWTQKANFGGGQRNGAVGFSIGNKGYIGTGWNITDYPVYFHQDFWQYDPPTDTWTRKADLPGPGRQTATGFSIGSKGYIGLGSEWSTNFQDFWEYDQQTDTWTQKSNFPAPGRQWATAFAIGTKGYMGTGGTYPNGPLYNDIWEYDQATDVWTQKANVGGTGRTLASGFSIGTKGYLGTGYDGSFQNDFWQYTPASDPCTPVLRMKNNTQPPPVTINTPSAISVYPNPNNGNMTISYFIPQNKKAELAIYDMSGRQVKNYFLKGENNQLSISEKDLQEGIYFYNVISNGNIIKQDKIVVIK
jgi:PKD repeat protein